MMPYSIKIMENNIKIEPISGTILAGEDKTITVSVTFFAPEYYEFIIQYLMRITSYTDALVPDWIPRSICKLRCLCVLPTLKVKIVHDLV